MPNNLQTFYLQQLELALQTALRGPLEDAIDMLFELRQKPDLALYTRGLVNTSLADLTKIEDFPDKIKFVQEAKRLADELLNDNDQENNAYMIQSYTELLTRATEKIRVVEAEQEAYEKAMKEEEKEKEAKPLSETAGQVTYYPTYDGSKPVKVVDFGDGWFEVDPPEETTASNVPSIEGTFSTRSRTRGDATGESSSKPTMQHPSPNDTSGVGAEDDQSK